MANPPHLDLNLDGQDSLASAIQADTTISSQGRPDRPSIPTIEVPPGSEAAIDPSSPPPHDSKEADDSTTTSPEHKDNIPLTNMPPSTSTAAAADDNAAGTESIKTANHPPPPPPPVDNAEPPTTQSFIGPSTGGPTDAVVADPKDEPAVYTTLCVANTENRHPWKITADYLRRRGEQVPTTAPAGTELLDVKISTLKRMLHADWRSDWESRPAESSQIRLISMGEQLQDGRTLRDHRFKVNGQPRPILLSVRRPVEDDNDAEQDVPSKNPVTSTDDDGAPRSRMCCCTIM